MVCVDLCKADLLAKDLSDRNSYFLLRALESDKCCLEMMLGGIILVISD